jgi:hypothetical protein
MMRLDELEWVPDERGWEGVADLGNLIVKYRGSEPVYTTTPTQSGNYAIEVKRPALGQKRYYSNLEPIMAQCLLYELLGGTVGFTVGAGDPKTS